MAKKKPNPELLRKILCDTRFNFIPKGKIELQNIYTMVKAFYPALCDDSIRREDNGEIEWHHQVRWALEHYKKKPVVKSSGKKGIWIFS